MWKSLALLALCCAAALGQTALRLKTGGKSTSTQLKTMVPSTDQVEMWDRMGNLNPRVLASFPRNLQLLYTSLSAIPVYDMKNARTPQDLYVTLNEVSKLNGTVQAAFAALAVSPAAFPVKYLSKLPLFIFSLIATPGMRTIASRFTTLQRGAICGRLVREHVDPETVEILIAGIDCVPTFTSLRLGKHLRRDIAYALFKGIKKRQPISGWANSDWTAAMEICQGMEPGDIGMIPTPVILANIPKFTEILPKLDPRLRMAIIGRCVKAVGGYGNFSMAQMRLLVPFLKYMRASDIRRFPRAMMPAIASIMSRMKFEDPNQVNEIGDMLREQQGDPRNWTLAQFKDAGAMLISREHTMQQVSISILNASMLELGQDRKTAREAAPVLERIMKDPSLMYPANWSRAAILCKAKHLLVGMDVSFLKQISGRELVKVLHCLKDVEFSNAQRRAVWDRVKPHLPKALHMMNVSEIGDMKAVLRGMTGEEINRFNGTHLGDALGELGDGAKLGRGQSQACINRLNNQLTGGAKGAIDKLGSFARKLPTSAIRNATDSVLGVSGDKQMATDCEEDQCKVLMERIKKSRGNVTDPRFTPKVIRNYGKAILGLSEDDVKNLPKGRVLMTVIDQVCTFAKRNNVPNVLMQALALKLKAVYNMTAPNVTARITHTAVVQSTCLAKFFSEQELDGFGKTHCRDIVNGLSSMPLDDIDPKQLKGLFRFAAKCLNRTGVLDTEFMEKAGNAICGLEPHHLDKFNRTVFFNFVARLGSRCNFDENMRRKIADKFMTEYSVVLSAPANMTKIHKLGGLVATLTPNELSQIPSSVLLDMCQDIAENADKLRDIKKSRSKRGQKADTSASDKKLYKEGVARVMKACTDARQAAAAGGGGGGVGRRRRQSSALTCSQLKAMGSSVISLTSSQIQSISDTDFMNCADFLGNETDWTAAQKTELANVAQRTNVWSTPNTWSTANVQDAGTIAQGLTSSQIGMITFGSMDGISELGDYDGWSSAQLTSGFAKWLVDYKSSMASNVNQTELISMGHFACGADSTHISSIPAAEYGGAASSIGQLDTCSHTLGHWAGKALTYYGSVSSWSASDVSTIGVVIGGLQSSDLASFTSSHVQSISVTVIPNLPANTLASLSVTQLGYMSSAQASAVTATQQASMTSAQLLVLQSLGATLYTSGSVTLVPCLTLLVAALVAKLM